MSQWTHVNAIIRIDSLRMFMKNVPNIGIPSSWEDRHQAKDIPCGSEGSLYAKIWEDPNRSAMAAYTVSVWGDLRDYDDEDEIVAYLHQITDGQMIRSGIAEIDVEYKTKKLYQYINDAWVMISETKNE